MPNWAWNALLKRNHMALPWVQIWDDGCKCQLSFMKDIWRVKTNHRARFFLWIKSWNRIHFLSVEIHVTNRSWENVQGVEQNQQGRLVIQQNPRNNFTLWSFYWFFFFYLLSQRCCLSLFSACTLVYWCVFDNITLENVPNYSVLTLLLDWNLSA